MQSASSGECLAKGPNILAVYEIWWQFGRGVNNARWCLNRHDRFRHPCWLAFERFGFGAAMPSKKNVTGTLSVLAELIEPAGTYAIARVFVLLHLLISYA